MYSFYRNYTVDIEGKTHRIDLYDRTFKKGDYIFDIGDFTHGIIKHIVGKDDSHTPEYVIVKDCNALEMEVETNRLVKLRVMRQWEIKLWPIRNWIYSKLLD